MFLAIVFFFFFFKGGKYFETLLFCLLECTHLLLYQCKIANPTFDDNYSCSPSFVISDHNQPSLPHQPPPHQPPPHQPPSPHHHVDMIPPGVDDGHPNGYIPNKEYRPEHYSPHPNKPYPDKQMPQAENRPGEIIRKIFSSSQDSTYTFIEP